eukprot:gene466-1109_t
MPEEMRLIKEIADSQNDQFKDQDVLLELGIWKMENANDPVEEEEPSEKWSSINTNDDEEEKGANAETPTKPTFPEPAYMLQMLPRGGTADILRSPTPTESSRYSYYATELDEYESDAIHSHVPGGVVLPMSNSAKSEAGDSDDVYCVPSVAKRLHESSTNVEEKGASKQDLKRQRAKQIREESDEPDKVKRRKTRRELDELFVQAFMLKHKVRDVTINQYGGATKAFRLRMAKLGKDPVRVDNKVNQKIEDKIRRKLVKGNQRRKKLIRENLVKLPNVSKKAKVMRWISVQRKGQMNNLTVVYENGWMQESRDLEKSMRLVDEETTHRRPPMLKKESMRLRSFDDEAAGGPAITQNDAVVEEDTMNVDISMKNKREDMMEGGDSDVNDDVSAKSEEDELMEDDNKANKSCSCDSEDSMWPPESPSPPLTRRGVRYPTPDTEPEPEPELEPEPEPEPEPEKPKKPKHIASLNWKSLRPKLIFGKPWHTYNDEFSDITRVLFSQLTLKTKDYSKLPPIRKKSRSDTMNTHQSGRSIHSLTKRTITTTPAVVTATATATQATATTTPSKHS